MGKEGYRELAEVKSNCVNYKGQSGSYENIRSGSVYFKSKQFWKQDLFEAMCKNGWPVTQE